MDDVPRQGTDTADRERSEELRRSLDLVMVAWIFGAVWAYATSGAALTRWAQLMGLSPFGFGLLGALPFAGALIQLPVSLILERFGGHRRLFIAAGMLNRFPWIIAAIIPWVLPASAWGSALLAVVLLTSLAGQALGPIFVSWMADLVPARVWGRYFARRTQLGQIVGLLVTVGASYLMDHAGQAGGAALMRVLSILFAVAGLFGMVDFCFFFPVRAPEFTKRTAVLPFWKLVRAPVLDPNFRRFMGFSATMTFATAGIGQFVWLYIFDVAGMSNTRGNVLLVVVPLLVALLSVRFWGRMIDRFGRKPVLIMAGCLVVHGAAGWMFITKDSWVVPYLGLIVAMAAWPGIDMANFNLLLGMSDARSGRRHGSVYVAVNALVVAVAGVLSGVCGGALAEWLKDYRGSFLGHPLTYHGVLFLISGGLRVVALFWLVGLEDRRAYQTREALGYVWSGFYAGLHRTLTMPGRLALRLGRWTYKAIPKR